MYKSGIKVIIALLTAVFMSLSFAACGEEKAAKTENTSSAVTEAATNAEATTAAPKAPVTLSIATYTAWNNEGLKNLIAKYEEVSGNKIDLQLIPDDQFINLMNTKLTSGDVPDIIANHANTYMYPVLAKNAVSLDGPWTQNLNDVAKYQATRAEDGKIITAPYGASDTLGAIYNKEVFKKAGINGPFKSYTELLEACKAIKSIGLTPITVPNKDVWTTQCLALAGINVAFEKTPSLADKIAANKIKPSEVPEIVDVFNRVVDLQKKGYINSDCNSTVYTDSMRNISEGTAGMLILNNAMYGLFAKDYADKVGNLGYMPFTLTDDLPYLINNGNAAGFYVCNSKNIDTSKEFVDTIMTPEVGISYFEKLPGISALKTETENFPANPWDKEYFSYDGWKQLAQMQTQYFQPRGFDCGGEWSLVAQAVLMGKDVVKALDDWYLEYVKLNKGLKTPGF